MIPRRHTPSPKALWAQMRDAKNPPQKKPMKRLKRGPIKRKPPSPEQRQYKREARAFVLECLADPVRQWCPVLKEVSAELLLSWGIDKDKLTESQLKVNQNHHMHGRRRSLLLYKPWWMAVSELGHWVINNHPSEARKHGFLCEIGQYDVEPGRSKLPNGSLKRNLFTCIENENAP